MSKTSGLSRAQVDALRILSDGQPHKTTKRNLAPCISGRTADALKRMGCATIGKDEWGVGWAFTITDAGRRALARHEEQRRCER